MLLPDRNSTFRLVPILLAQGVGLACGIVGVKLNSALIPPEKLGLYGVFLTFAPIGMWVVHAGLIKYVNRHWAAAASRAALLHLTAQVWARRLPWLLAAAILGGFILGDNTSRQTALLSAALFVAAALLAASALAQAALQAEAAHWRDCFVSGVGSISRTLLPPLFFVASGGALGALWLGFASHAVTTAVTAAWALRRSWGGTTEAIPPSRVMPMEYHGAMFTLLAAAGWVLAGMNRWIVTGFFGEQEAGYFTLAGGAAVVVASTLGAAFVQYFQPGIFRAADHPQLNLHRLARHVDFVALCYTATALSAVAILALLGPRLVGPLIAESYRAALPWILPGGCFGVAIITTVFYQSLLLATRREQACAPVELTTAVVLASGCVISAALGAADFKRWLIATPLVPWLVTRMLARWYLFKQGANATRAPDR
jgi:hypothetical protein